MRMKYILNRPLAPHLTIYSSQLTSIYSIWHRITGLSIVFILILFLSYLKITLYSVYGTTFIIFLWIKNSFFINLILFISYHILNGIRHIIWDLGFNLPIKVVSSSAKILSIILFCYLLFFIVKILI